MKDCGLLFRGGSRTNKRMKDSKNQNMMNLWDGFGWGCWNNISVNVQVVKLEKLFGKNVICYVKAWKSEFCVGKVLVKR